MSHHGWKKRWWELGRRPSPHIAPPLWGSSHTIFASNSHIWSCCHPSNSRKVVTGEKPTSDLQLASAFLSEVGSLWQPPVTRGPRMWRCWIPHCLKGLRSTLGISESEGLFRGVGKPSQTKLSQEHTWGKSGYLRFEKIASLLLCRRGPHHLLKVFTCWEAELSQARCGSLTSISNFLSSWGNSCESFQC